MNKLEKPIKGKHLVTLVEKFFDKFIKKLNQVHSQDYIESELGDNIGANAKYVRVNNGQHIETFLKQLIAEGIGNVNSYVGLKIEVIKDNKVYSGEVEIVQINSTNIILRPKEAFGEYIGTPATVRLYIAPLLTSNAQSSIIYNSIVTSNSKYNFILGERNIHKGKDNVWILGKNNVSRETNQNSLIDGYNNDVDSYGNLVIGDNNKHRSYYGATVGQRNKNFKKNSFLFGEGHDNANGSQYGTVFGKYSKIEADTLFAIGDGDNESNRHNLFELKRGGEILDKDGNDIRNGGGSQVQSDWNENDNSKPAYIKNKPNVVSSVTEITWSDLKILRDTSKLIPSAIYMVTDYKATTVDPESRSTDNTRNILIKAINKSKFDENAICLTSSGNWSIKYCFDNDTNRFAWADSVNGKGVIYWMKDNRGNEFPYDAYNIEFKRYKVVECELIPDLIGNYVTKNIYNAVVDENDFIYKGINDSIYVYNNIIKPWFKRNGICQQILNNITLSGDSHYNMFYENCNNIDLAGDCYMNIFGTNCSTINLFRSNQENVFKNYCSFITSSNNNIRNIFGNWCFNVIINRLSTSNTIGDNCNNITIYVDNKFVVIENDCDYIQIKRDKVRYVTIKHNNHYIDVVSTLNINYQIQNFIILSNTNISNTIKVITHDISNNDYPIIYKSINSQEIEV